MRSPVSTARSRSKKRSRSNRRESKRARQLKIGLLGVMAAAVFGLAAFALAPKAHVSTYSAPPKSTVAPQPSAAPKPTAVIIGDSYLASQVQHANPAVGDRIGTDMGWSFTNLASGGTGYIANGYEGENKPTYLDRVKSLAGKSPTVLLLEGGANDRTGHTLAEGTAALEETLSTAETLMPKTLIVVAGPLWSGSMNVGEQWRVGYKEVLAAHPSVVWIDTVSAGWFPGAFFVSSPERDKFIGPDKVHPNDAGAALLTSKVVAALQAAGVPSGSK